MAEFIQIVDEQDNVIGAKERDQLLPTDIYRVASLWVRNSRGEVLLLKRAASKANQPNCWHPMSGTVRAGESYEENVRREAEEELGIRGERFELGLKMYHDQPKRRLFSQGFWFTCDKLASAFTLDQKDNSEARWWPLDELRRELVAHPEWFVPSLRGSVEARFPQE